MGSSGAYRRWLGRSCASAVLAHASWASAQLPAPADEPGPPPSAPAPARVSSASTQLPKDFVLQQTPWVDVSLTNFWMAERTGNFLNVGVQVGAYLIERIRLTARLVAPLEETSDSYSEYSDDFGLSSSYRTFDSRSVSLLYGLSFGLILSNSRSFVFAPGVTLWRTDVSDYGTTGALSLPFEWTTQRRLRIGFELALGHSFGGEVQRLCTVPSSSGGSSSCGLTSQDRPGGTAFLLQFQMGWALAGP